MIIFKAFQGLENFYIKFKDFPYFSKICTNPVANCILNRLTHAKLAYINMHADKQYCLP